MAKLWFSLYDKEIYRGNEDAFIESFNHEGYEILKNNHKLVYDELKKYLTKFQFEPQFNNTMVEIPKSWKVRSLRVWGVEMYDIQEHFPETMKLVNAIPYVVNIGFNLLEPHSKIKPHCGDTNANYRCHLGLLVPEDYKKCVMKVKNIEKHWKQGEIISFLDAHEHEAWNNSNEQRIILLFDVLKPEFETQKNKVCATVLSSFYLQRIGNFWKGIYSIDRKKLKYLLFPLVFIMRMLIPIRNKLKK